MASYRAVLTYVPKAVARAVSEKSITKLLDIVGTSSNLGFVESFCQETLRMLAEQNNDVCVLLSAGT